MTVAREKKRKSEEEEGRKKSVFLHFFFSLRSKGEKESEKTLVSSPSCAACVRARLALSVSLSARETWPAFEEEEESAKKRLSDRTEEKKKGRRRHRRRRRRRRPRSSFFSLSFSLRVPCLEHARSPCEREACDVLCAPSSGERRKGNLSLWAKKEKKEEKLGGPIGAMEFFLVLLLLYLALARLPLPSPVLFRAARKTITTHSRCLRREQAQKRTARGQKSMTMMKEDQKKKTTLVFFFLNLDLLFIFTPSSL